MGIPPIKYLCRPLALLVVTLGLVSCSSPETKVQQMEAQKKVLMESSGYNACMKKIADADAAEQKCITDELVAKGYTDGVRCVGTGEYDKRALCKDVKRYNAEVDADNDCQAKINDPNALTELDCAKMLQETTQ